MEGRNQDLLSKYGTKMTVRRGCGDLALQGKPESAAPVAGLLMRTWSHSIKPVRLRK
ncbi:hypothetical protein LKO27_09940 [Tessaracoccus sp. OS52]|uniref:hypothetical protein n=1 Tax=Tessaracoccus sp. OS52 TaxID=2886691 RepID=UPI001D11B7B3|nr:hypothetical protein [Tessaracoccus sp. OS52]MCC2593724.1 hypothetical protein [Tessaracoccus sp. OS52]